MLSGATNGQAVLQTDRCVNEIICGIRQGTLRPSQRLGEASFARKMGLNRQTVRTAFDRLVTMGMLKRIHRSGTFVNQLGLEQYCELMDVRALLEGQAAFWASQHASASELRELARIAKTLDDLVAKQTPAQKAAIPPEVQRLEREFHGRVARLSGNRFLERLISMQDLVACSFNAAKALKASVQDGDPFGSHRQLVDAIASRFPEQAAQAMREHILQTKERIVKSLTGIMKETSMSPLLA